MRADSGTILSEGDNVVDGTSDLALWNESDNNSIEVKAT